MRVFIVPLRTDFEGMSVQVLDLKPNTSLKNNNLEGVGETHYVPPGIDTFGATVFHADAYASGSKNSLGFADAAADDTTGGGNDVLSTPGPALGLAAYLRERVQPGGVVAAAAGRMAVADSITLGTELLNRLGNGDELALADINTVLSNVAFGGTVGTDLDGTAALSKSFGTVLEVFRILTGEVYRSPSNTIICNVANQFRSEAERDVLVAAQDVAANGGTTFVSKGAFLTTTENGYEGIPELAWTEAMAGSINGGQLHEMLGATQDMTFTNPAFAYAAADVTADMPRAFYWDAAAPHVIPATGVAPGLTVYDEDGNFIA